MGRQRTPEREERLRTVIARRQPTLTVVLENIHDPHNVAAILRTADSVGILEVQLVYTYEEFPDLMRYGKKSSAGTRKWLARRHHGSVEDCLGDLAQRGFCVYTSTLERDSRPLYELDLARPVALLFGNEHRGASPEAISGAAGTFHIPMAGMAQSLNVSVAVAVALYEAFRQRRAAGMYDHPQLGEEEREELLREWRER